MVPLKKEMLEELIKYLEEDITAYQSAINQMVKNRIALRKQGTNPKAVEALQNLEIQFNAISGKNNLARNLLSFSKKMLQEEIELYEIEKEIPK